MPCSKYTVCINSWMSLCFVLQCRTILTFLKMFRCHLHQIICHSKNVSFYWCWFINNQDLFNPIFVFISVNFFVKLKSKYFYYSNDSFIVNNHWCMRPNLVSATLILKLLKPLKRTLLRKHTTNERTSVQSGDITLVMSHRSVFPCIGDACDNALQVCRRCRQIIYWERCVCGNRDQIHTEKPALTPLYFIGIGRGVHLQHHRYS